MNIEEQYGVEDYDHALVDAVEQRELAAMLQEALEFVTGFRWCKGVQSTYVGFWIDGVIAVFLLAVDNAASPQDDLLWVVVGDVPPAYLVAQDGPENPAQALQEYLELVSQWVDAVKAGASITDLIPVNAPPTVEYAEMLASRVEYLRSEVLQKCL